MSKNKSKSSHHKSTIYPSKFSVGDLVIDNLGIVGVVVQLWKDSAEAKQTGYFHLDKYLVKNERGHTWLYGSDLKKVHKNVYAYNPKEVEKERHIEYEYKPQTQDIILPSGQLAQVQLKPPKPPRNSFNNNIYNPPSGPSGPSGPLGPSNLNDPIYYYSLTQEPQIPVAKYYSPKSYKLYDDDIQLRRRSKRTSKKSTKKSTKK